MNMFYVRSIICIASLSRFMMHVYYSKEYQMKFFYLDDKYHAIVFPFKKVFCLH